MHVPHILDMCPTSPRPCRWHGPLHHVLMQVRVPGVSTTARHPSTLVPRSSHNAHPSPLPVYRHELTWPPSSTIVPVLHTCTPQADQDGCTTHNLTPRSVHDSTRDTTRWQSLITNPNQYGQFNLVFATTLHDMRLQHMHVATWKIDTHLPPALHALVTLFILDRLLWSSWFVLACMIMSL
jgi:hypothetical protein